MCPSRTLFWFVLGIIFHGTLTVKVEKATFQIIRGQILSSSVEIALFSLNLDEEIYLLDSFVDCQYFYDEKCSNPTQVDCQLNNTLEHPLDFSSSVETRCLFSSCNYSSNLKSECVSQCQHCGNSTLSLCESDDHFLSIYVNESSPIGNWIQLQEGVKHVFNTSSNHTFHNMFLFTNYYRFYLPETCDPVKIRVRAIQGDPDLKVGRLHPFWDQKNMNNPHCQNFYPKWAGKRRGSEEVILCPSDPHFGVGTYYLEVKDWSPNPTPESQQPSIWEIWWMRIQDRRYRINQRPPESYSMFPHLATLSGIAKPKVSGDTLHLLDGQEVIAEQPRWSYTIPNLKCPVFLSLSVKVPSFERRRLTSSIFITQSRTFRGSQRFAVALCDPEQQQLQNSTVSFRLSSFEQNDWVWVTITSDPFLIFSQPISSMPVDELTLHTTGHTRLVCGPSTFTDLTGNLYREEKYRPLVRITPFYSLWPLNPHFRVQGGHLSFPPDVDRYPPKEWHSELIITQAQNKHEKEIFLPLKNLTTCTMEFGRKFVDMRNSTFYNLNFTFKPQSRRFCLAAELKELDTRFRDLSNALSNCRDPYQTHQLAFQLDQLMFSRPRSDCESQTKSLMNTTRRYGTFAIQCPYSALILSLIHI
eukprot:TRINITY_DN8416_c0_g1_i1.p1 TRINITY_DN8416_c0_g1~~TRINITY_DN8416_c0_g1_i1.p1  ORF type:complete len:640 (-),score=104.97 TRINITY_DN8416_c0_g1_i1:40-1959(-)